MIPSPYRKRERIMGFGLPDSGKSSMWVSLAQWIADTQTDSRLYVGDTDDTWDASGYDELEKVVTPTHITDYRSGVAWSKPLKSLVRPQDWVVFDLADRAWPWSQEHYWEGKLGDDMLMGDVMLRNQRFMENPKDPEGESAAGAHGANWGVIYNYYHGLVNNLLNLPCHVLFIAAAKELRKDSDVALQAEYKGVGFYPAGPPNENALAHNFHSVIFCAETPMGWIYKGVKERGPLGKPTRKLLKGEPVEDFVSTYLMKVAGWKL